MLFYNVIYDLYRGFNPNNPYAPPGGITVACELNGELVHHVRHGRFGTGKYLHWTNVLMVPEETDIRSGYNSQLNAFNAGNADTVIVHDYPIPGWHSAFLVVDVQVMSRGLTGVYRRCYLDRARPKKGPAPFCQVGVGGLNPPSMADGQIILSGIVNANGPPPAQISLKDMFTDSDNTPLTSHTMDTGPGWAQEVWTNAGTWEIDSNACKLVSTDTSAPNDYLLWSDNHASDTTLSVAITAPVAEPPGGPYPNNISAPGVVFRLQDHDNYWLAAFNINPVGLGGAFQIYLYYKSAGVYHAADGPVNLGTYSGSPIPVSVVCSGNSIKVYVSGALTVQSTSSFLNTATSYGFRESIQGGVNPQHTCTYDNFLVTTP